MKKAGLVASLQLGILLVLVFALSGCGAEPSLRSIEVQPAPGVAIVDAGKTVQFLAIGSYVKSNQTTYTKDITTQVTWQSFPSAVATINSSGMASAISSGVPTITASLNNLVGTSDMAVNPGNQVPRLTLETVGAGAGTVTSSPGPINCGTVCSAFYATPTKVTLTATPTVSSTFGGWSANCSPNTLPTSAPKLGEVFSCTVDVSVPTIVEAIFN